MFTPRTLSIKQEVFFLGALFSFLTLVTFGVLFFSVLGTVKVDKAKTSLQETNAKIGLVTESLFKEMRSMVDALTAIPQIAHITSAGHGDATQALRIYKEITAANEDIEYLYSGYEDGSLLINDYVAPEGYFAPERPWYVSALERMPEQSFGLPYREAKTGEWLISQSKALTDAGGQVTGVVSIDVSLSRINRLLAETKQYASQKTFLLDREGKVIIHPDNKIIGQKLPHITDHLKGKSGEFFHADGADERWAFFNTLDPVGWTVVTTVQRTEVVAPIMVTTFYYTTLVVFIAIVLGTIQSRYFGKRLAEPLIGLGKRIAEIVDGKPRTDLEYDRSNREIAAIASNIEELTKRALQKKATELRTILESSRDGILVVDNHGRVVYVNSRLREMWGIPPEAPLHSDESHLSVLFTGQLEHPDSFVA